jgi:hypothetical protein
MTDFGRKCVSCAYWAPPPESDKTWQEMLDKCLSGECRRHAPAPRPIWQLARLMEPTAETTDWADIYGSDEDARATWPVTWADSWCGEYVKKPQPA